MLKRAYFAKLIALAGGLMLPMLASAAGDLCYLRDAAAPSATTAYLLCEQGQIYATNDAGGKWVMYRTKADRLVHAVYFKDNLHGLVVGDGGTILATDDGAKTWQQRLNDKKEHFTTEHLLDIQAIGDQVWISGFTGTMLHSSDFGRTWEKQKTGTTMALQGIFFLDANRGWAVGWSGTILRTADGGKNWEDIDAKAATWSLNAVYFRNEKEGWASGFSGELLRSRDGGATWEALKSPVMSTLSSITFDKEGRLWVAADEQLIVSQDGGNTWKTTAGDNYMFLSRFFRAGDSLWAMGELGLLKHTAQADGMEWKRDNNFVASGTSIQDTIEDASAADEAVAPASPTAK
jgi:photosystem II stability/assembly factor-like uncharacterized protein